MAELCKVERDSHYSTHLDLWPHLHLQLTTGMLLPEDCPWGIQKVSHSSCCGILLCRFCTEQGTNLNDFQGPFKLCDSVHNGLYSICNRYKRRLYKCYKVFQHRRNEISQIPILLYNIWPVLTNRRTATEGNATLLLGQCIFNLRNHFLLPLHVLLLLQVLPGN